MRRRGSQSIGRVEGINLVPDTTTREIKSSTNPVVKTIEYLLQTDDAVGTRNVSSALCHPIDIAQIGVVGAAGGES